MLNQSYKFVHTELVPVSMILNGSGHVLLNLKKNNKQFLKIDPGTQKNWEC